MLFTLYCSISTITTCQKMKRIYILSLAAIFGLSACQKEAVSPQNGQLSRSLIPGSVSTTTNDAGLSTSASSFLRLQLAKDSIFKDDILINFKQDASAAYVVNEDSRYFPGNGAVSLASLSSDNVALAINALPLAQQGVSIGLQVNAQQDGVYKLNMTAISLPPTYKVWLLDKYKKDSLDMGLSQPYIFNLIKADTNSYGSGRFSLVVRQTVAPAAQLLDFTAVKATNSVRMTWKTAYESNNTFFTVERSTDKGETFSGIAGLTSTDVGTYSFLDIMLKGKPAQYRLKMQDVSGTVTYSKVIATN